MATLSARISAALTSIGVDVKALFAARVPTGGAAGQVLTKTGVPDHAMAWQPAGAGSAQVFVQSTRPLGNGPWIWWQTDSSGQIVDCTVANGSP
jgi:hypothetical protein